MNIDNSGDQKRLHNSDDYNSSMNKFMDFSADDPEGQKKSSGSAHADEGTNLKNKGSEGYSHSETARDPDPENNNKATSPPF